GICTSVIRHVVSATQSDPRKCSADLKVTALYPSDSTSSRMPSRASASSSTIEINGASDIPVAWRASLPRLSTKSQLIFGIFDLAQRSGRSAQCPLWVISGHRFGWTRCPLYPQKQTWISWAVMSALCQKQTSLSTAQDGAPGSATVEPGALRCHFLSFF